MQLAEIADRQLTVTYECQFCQCCDMALLNCVLARYTWHAFRVGLVRTVTARIPSEFFHYLSKIISSLKRFIN